MEPARRTILTIDDNEVVREFIHTILTGSGYRVLEAEDGPRGLEVAVHEKLDVILLDVNMPGMDGHEVAARLKQDPRTRTVPIVMLTGANLSEDAVAGLEAGADEYLHKPIPMAELIARVAALVRRRELEEELVRLEQERMETRLAFAREIQHQLLPREGWCPEGLAAAVRYRPCETLGGDFYDWIEPAGEACLVLGDAEGHGVGAAIWMATARAYVRASLGSGEFRPARLLGEVNRLICGDRGHSALLPVLCVSFDRKARRIRWANAGHEAPLLSRKATREIVALESTGPLLGMMADAVFEEGEAAFLPGDTLVCFTDGLTEAFDAEQNQFGRERLHALVRECREFAPNDLADRLVNAWRAYVGNRIRDDLTLIVARGC